MPWRVHDLERAERVAVCERLVDVERGVLRDAERDPEPELDQARRPWRERDALRPPPSRQDVPLGRMRVDLRTGQAPQRRSASEVRPVPVGDRDPLQLGPAPAELRERLQDDASVRVPERVDERQLAAALDEEGVDVTALLLAERPEAGCQLLQAVTRRHGPNPFSTPRSAGPSDG